MLAFHLARFEVDATPPTAISLCGGWIKPVEGVDDPLSLRGVVLIGAGMPIVLAALDWTGVMDESHRLWTEALADAAHTTPDRVALHCVHQHNAPFIDRDGNALLKTAGAAPLLYDEAFVDDLITRSAGAVRRPRSRPLGQSPTSARERRRSSRSPAIVESSAPTARSSTPATSARRTRPPVPSPKGRSIRSYVGRLLPERPAARPALLLHDSPDELLRRRPRLVRLRRAGPQPPRQRRARRAPRLFHRLGRQRHGRQVQRRLTARCVPSWPTGSTRDGRRRPRRRRSAPSRSTRSPGTHCRSVSASGGPRPRRAQGDRRRPQATVVERNRSAMACGWLDTGRVGRRSCSRDWISAGRRFSTCLPRPSSNISSTPSESDPPDFWPRPPMATADPGIFP